MPAALIFQAFKGGCPIRKSSDQSSFAAPRRLSQRITSFIACACQGIHQLPLRHLIVLIANAHPRANPQDLSRSFPAHDPDPKSLATFWGHGLAMALAQKDQLLEIGPGAAVRQAHQLPGVERSRRRTACFTARPQTKGYAPLAARLRRRNPNKSSLHDVMQNRRRPFGLPQTFFQVDEWWSRTGSNRRPPACKAGALPAELRPLISW